MSNTKQIWCGLLIKKMNQCIVLFNICLRDLTKVFNTKKLLVWIPKVSGKEINGKNISLMFRREESDFYPQTDAEYLMF